MSDGFYALYVGLIAICMVVPLADIVILVNNGKSSKVTNLLICLLACVAFDCLGFLLDATAVSEEAMAIALQIEFIGGDLAIMVMIFFFYTWCEVRMPRWFSTMVVAVFSTFCVLTLTNRYQNWYYQLTGFYYDGRLPAAVLAYGPVSTVESVAAVLLLGLGITLLLRSYARRKGKGRRTYLYVGAAGMIPIVVNLVSTYVSFDFDLMPLAFLICNSILTWCVLTRKIFDVVERAYEDLVEDLNEAAVVLDLSGRVLYANPSARGLFPELDDGAAMPRALESFCAASGRDDIYYQGRYYKTSVTVLSDDEGVHGRAALIVDVSHLQKLKKLLEAENARIEEELSLAAQIQASALPRIFPPWPERRDFDIYAAMDPAREVGGDFYDFFLVDDSHLGAVIADVSGKGVPAALFMMKAKACIKDRMMAGMAPGAAFSAASDQLVEGNDAELFVTAWAVCVDLRTGDAVYANAGHNPPYVYRSSAGRWEPVKSRPNIVLADDIGAKYRLNTLHLDAGDILFMYTDGLPEAADPDDGRYENARMEAVLEAQPADAPLEAVLASMKDDVDAFARGRDQFDDITMLALRINATRRQITVKADLGQSNAVKNFIAGWLADCRCPDRPRRQILMAQDEIFSNIVRYAYAGRPESGEVLIELWLEGDSAALRLTDSGVPFNPLDVTRKPHPYEDDWAEGGEGIHLVRAMMDSLSYAFEDGRNRLTMKKTIA
jgi:serine phosphatase RsbU (regulator of sigma subunit)/anti-sigma regulatory factor (Ser/Thr protein kinase)